MQKQLVLLWLSFVEMEISNCIEKNCFSRNYNTHLWKLDSSSANCLQGFVFSLNWTRTLILLVFSNVLKTLPTNISKFAPPFLLGIIENYKYPFFGGIQVKARQFDINFREITTTVQKQFLFLLLCRPLRSPETFKPQSRKIYQTAFSHCIWRCFEPDL